MHRGGVKVLVTSREAPALHARFRAIPKAMTKYVRVRVLENVASVVLVSLRDAPCPTLMQTMKKRTSWDVFGIRRPDKTPFIA